VVVGGNINDVFEEVSTVPFVAGGTVGWVLFLDSV